jgi:hypothetical protein
MGSPTRRKEIALCAAAFAGTAVLGAIVIALRNAGILPEGAPLRLAVLGVITFKLAISYHISAVQSRTFHVYEYYGGPVRNAGRILGASLLVRGFVIGLVDHPLWVIIVAGAVPGAHPGPWGW